MPLEGLRFLPKDELLTPAEFETVTRAAVSIGFRKFRLTGGEPTLRLDLVEIVERLARVPGVEGLALTTNALLLHELAPALKRAGLNRIIPPLRRWNIPEAVTGGLLAAVLTLIAYVGLGIEIGFSLDARVMRRDKSPSRLMFLRCSRKSLPTQQCHGEGRRGRKEVMATFIVICQ